MKSIKQILKEHPKLNHTTRKDLGLILQLYELSGGVAKVGERILKQEPYFSNDQNYCNDTIRRIWRYAGLKIRARGGANHVK